MSKILYFDVETTGLDPVMNDIIQIAGIIVINGKVAEEFEFKVAPLHPENASQEALDVHGYSLEQIMQFEQPQVIYQQLLSIFGKYVDKFDKNDKMTPAGYNVRFDMEFLKQFFLKNDDVYFGSWLNWKMIDPLPILHFIDFAAGISLPEITSWSLSALISALKFRRMMLSRISVQPDSLSQLSLGCFSKKINQMTIYLIWLKWFVMVRLLLMNFSLLHQSIDVRRN